MPPPSGRGVNVQYYYGSCSGTPGCIHESHIKAEMPEFVRKNVGWTFAVEYKEKTIRGQCEASAMGNRDCKQHSVSVSAERSRQPRWRGKQPPNWARKLGIAYQQGGTLEFGWTAWNDGMKGLYAGTGDIWTSIYGEWCSHAERARAKLKIYGKMGIQPKYQPWKVKNGRWVKDPCPITLTGYVAVGAEGAVQVSAPWDRCDCGHCGGHSVAHAHGEIKLEATMEQVGCEPHLTDVTFKLSASARIYAMGVSIDKSWGSESWTLHDIYLDTYHRGHR